MENTLLNLIPAAYLPEVHLSQYDVGRTITFTLKDGASDYSVPSGASVKVKATKPSGFGFEVACTFNGGTVTLVTTDTMTPENGRFPAELSIVSGNTTIGTSNFIFNIERSPHPEGTIDGDAETIIPELTLLVERIEAAAEDVDEKAELFLNLSAEAETLPAGSLATANYSDGVLTLGIPRGYDGDDTKADAIVKSASGEVASFTDGGNGLLVKSLNVNITPKQSGSGDPSPSNVRPISGYDTVNIHVSPTTTAGDGNTYPISLGQTVYGGTLDVVSGVLTIKWGIYRRTILASEGAVLGTYKRMGLNRAFNCDDAIRTQAISNIAKYVASYNNDTSHFYIEAKSSGATSNNLLMFVPADGNDYDIEVLYPLATPTEITLTPTQVKTLLGNNNIFADSGSVEVEYRADTTLAYNELLSLIASL